MVGHSWGTLVALALGLDHPERVRGLVLLSGYHSAQEQIVEAVDALSRRSAEIGQRSA